jgi:membrane associated rhomboid family serine protease
MLFFPIGTREGSFKQRFHYITIILLLINIAVFIMQAYLYVTGGESALAEFIKSFAVVPADITDGSFLEISLLTSMFLHAGLLHIAGNMIYFLPFGDNVEDRLGHIRYLFFYIACGVIATLSYTLFNSESTIPLLGASGAVAGVLGGYLVLYPGGIVKGIVCFLLYYSG